MFNKDLLRKFFVVFIGLLIFRLGSHVPVPGIDPIALKAMFAQTNGTILDMVNMFSGGSLKRLSIFALGVMPFISASIVIQMLTLTVPAFKEIKNEGMKGQLKISQYTRYLTILFGSMQAIGISQSLQGQVINGMPIVPHSGFAFTFIAVVTLLAGTFSLVWIGEKITEYGIGNGLSLIIFASIVSNIPLSVHGTMDLIKNGELSSAFGVLVIAVVVITLLFVITMEKAQRRIPVTNSKGDLKHAHKSFLPFKVNMAGVLPPILASSLILLPSTLGMWLSNATDVSFLQKVGAMFSHGSYVYLLTFCGLVIFFAYMFNSLQQNPYKIAERLKEQGTFIQGFRPGKETGNYLNGMMSRLTFIGASYLAIVCLVPEVLIYYWHIPFYFGGTSILIMVMVALEWQTQIKAHFRKNSYASLNDQIKNGLK